MTEYELHPEARLDLNEIWEFICVDSIDAADRVMAEIFARIEGLVRFPNQGYKRPDLKSRALRFATMRDYLTAYAPDEKPLWVLAVMHGKRNPRVMAAILRGR